MPPLPPIFIATCSLPKTLCCHIVFSCKSIGGVGRLMCFVFAFLGGLFGHLDVHLNESQKLLL